MNTVKPRVICAEFGCSGLVTPHTLDEFVTAYKVLNQGSMFSFNLITLIRYESLDLIKKSHI